MGANPEWVVTQRAAWDKHFHHMISGLTFKLYSRKKGALAPYGRYTKLTAGVIKTRVDFELYRNEFMDEDFSNVGSDGFPILSYSARKNFQPEQDMQNEYATVGYVYYPALILAIGNQSIIGRSLMLDLSAEMGFAVNSIRSYTFDTDKKYGYGDDGQGADGLYDSSKIYRDAWYSLTVPLLIRMRCGIWFGL